MAEVVPNDNVNPNLEDLPATEHEDLRVWGALRARSEEDDHESGMNFPQLKLKKNWRITQ